MANCGQWHLEREIGHGAYGVVFLAEGPDGERAAVKVCRRDAIGEERYERELRGAKLYRTIPSQEGLVRMREFVEESWGFYAVMDLADNEFGDRDFALDEYRPKTLADVIEGEKALPLDECVKLGMALAKGLATLQRHHLLHRDIKPGNVIYVGGRPVLSDPGLLVEESEATSLVGTPGYVPPENFTDAASDIYSLGLTLKAASFGRRLEDLDKGPALEADTGAKFFPAWWRILNKATDPVPSRRYQSAKALLKDLKALRFKIVVASKLGSRKAKATIIAASIAIVVFVGTVVLNDERMRTEVAAQKNEIARQRKEISVQHERVDRQNKEMSVQREQIDRQDKEMSAQREQIDRQNKEMSAQREQIDRENKEMSAQREQIDRQNKEMSAQREQIDRQNKEMAVQREQIDRQNKEMSVQREQIDRQNKEMAVQRERIDRQQETIDNQSREIAGKLDEIARYRDEIARQRNEIDRRAQEVAKQAKDISGRIEVHSILTGDETNLVSELHSLRQFKTDTENTFKRAEQESMWDWYLRTGTGLTRRLIKTHTRNIAKIAAIDATKAAVFRERIDRLNTLVEKEEAFHRAIVDIRKVDEEKRKRGIHVTEEYDQAKKIYKKKVAFHKTEVKPLEDELDAMFNRFKAENKDVQFDEMPLDELLGALHDE